MDMEKIADFWIAQIVGIGPVGKQILLEIFGSILSLFLSSSDEVRTLISKYRFGFIMKHDDAQINIHDYMGYNIEEKPKKRKYNITAAVVCRLADPSGRMSIIKEYKRVQKKEVRFITKKDAEYPKRLLDIFDPPEQLFVLGRLPEPDQKAIGIVGARECTPYGRDMARLFGYRLARAGMAVISGMAKGVDGWSHRGALEAGGDTFAVLGCGVEVVYPLCNEKLYHDIKDKGGLISEYPSTYGALSQNFPMRNRIISGLSDGILLIEARQRSGSLITVDQALEQGKDVFVIPGRIGDELSVGCNRLIRQGAIPVISPDDILEFYHIKSPDQSDDLPGLSSEEASILAMIGTNPISLASIAASAQGTYANTLRVVMRLKKNRYIRESSRDHFIRV